jgi:hypothetical protein
VPWTRPFLARYGPIGFFDDLSQDLRLPHLAKNKRDVGHPLTLGRTKSRGENFLITPVADSPTSPLGPQFFRFVHVRLLDKEPQSLALEQALVGALGSADQRVMRTLLDHATLLEDEDAVKHAHRR